MARQPADVLSHFWAPLCAVGSHGPAGPNAQICVSVFGASIVPERPRLLVSLSKTNLTRDLVETSGSLAITLLSDHQAHLLEPLGLRSGRDGPKLGALSHETTPAGDPYFPEGVGLIACEVIANFDAGDATLFLVAVRERRPLDRERPLPWAEAQSVVGEDFLRRWAEKSARERQVARERMLWR